MAQHLASKVDKAHVFYKLIQALMKTFRSEAEASSNHDAGGGGGGGGGKAAGGSSFPGRAAAGPESGKAKAKAKEEEEEEDTYTMKTDGSTSGFSGKDETIKCRGCSADFVFNVGAQAFYKARGLKHKPVRCRQCRAPQPKNP
jgi:hypothetical protein